MNSNGRILVVDDEETNVDLLSRRLQRAGFEVITASSGQRALDLLETNSVDVVLLDQMMPQMTGIDVLRRIRADGRLRDLPIIMVTAIHEGSAIAEALDTGANDYVTKPIEFQGAMARVRSQVARHRDHRRLSDSQSRLALASRGNGEGVWDQDPIVDRFCSSAELNAMLGMDFEETCCSALTWIQRLHPVDRLKVRADLMGIAPHVNESSPEVCPPSGEQGLHVECRILHQDGQYRWVSMKGTSVFSAAGRLIRRVGTITDITERKTIDPITGLGNRQKLFEQIESCIAGLASSSHASGVSLLIIKIKNFDELALIMSGEEVERTEREIGDSVRAAIGILQKDDRHGHTTLPFAAYLGGGELAFLLGNNEEPVLRSFAQYVVGALSRPFGSNGAEIYLSMCKGSANIDSQYHDPSAVLRDAATAVHAAGIAPGDGIVYFNESMNAARDRRLRLKMDLQVALSHGEFEVFYQPRVRLADSRICGFEALVRWNHPQRGMVSPVDFIPLAEEEGLIHEIGMWVLEQACQQTQIWVSAYALGADFEVAVNLSASQCHEPDLIARVKHALFQSGLAAQHLKLELTESIFLDDMKAANDVLLALKSLGIALKIDDFGTGYSCLKYLCDLPFDSVKIDRSFVMNMQTPGTETSKVVKSIIALADSLGMDVIAEGIDQLDQVKMLQEMGCDYGQGFLFSRPVSCVTAEELLKRQGPTSLA